jgi:hypothetical protein
MARWKSIPVVVGIIVLAYGGFIFAQTQQPPPARGGRTADGNPQMEQMIDMMFQDMDTNHDGKISKSEWMAFYEKQFRQLDRNGDGFITKDEVRADMMDRMRAQQRGPKPPQ